MALADYPGEDVGSGDPNIEKAFITRFVPDTLKA